ncbi:hypothetical protein NL676_037790 [Syzygium grande]|nr:hypothetical protein NL676_037790 [Syzygium grande]
MYKYKEKYITHPTKIALSDAKKSMKYKVASTENAMEYGFRGFSSLLLDESSTDLTLDVNPKAGLSKRFRVLEACDLVAAGALPVAFGTSNVALAHRARLTSARGVGTAAEQIGKVYGAVVIAVARPTSAFTPIKDRKVTGKVMVICEGPGSANLKFGITMRQCGDEE